MPLDSLSGNVVNMDQLTAAVTLFKSCLSSYRALSSAMPIAVETVEWEWDVLVRIELARFEIWGRTVGFLDEKSGREIQYLQVTEFADILQVEGAGSLVHDILKSLLQALDDFKSVAMEDEDKHPSLLATLETANDGLDKCLSASEQAHAARSLPSQVLTKYDTPTELDVFVKSGEVKNQHLALTAKSKQAILLSEDTPTKDFELSSTQFTGLPHEVNFDDDNPFSGSCTTARYISPDGSPHTVLIECQWPAPWDGTQIPKAELRRRNKIAALLMEASQLPRYEDTVCRVPECLGWFTFRGMNNGTGIELVGLASDVPPWVDATIPPYSLRKIMEQGYWAGNCRPSLNKRFSLARAVAQALYHLQCGGWLHRSLGGHQIIFFYDRESGNLRMDEPFLRGLTHSFSGQQIVERDQEVRHGLGWDLETVVETDVYRHPDLWTTNPRGYRPSDDIYSLGAVLFEIGMWRRVGPDVRQKEDVHLLRVARDALPAAAGEVYTQVVVDCLEGIQGEDSHEGDDGIGSQLLWKVLLPLEKLRV